MINDVKNAKTVNMTDNIDNTNVQMIYVLYFSFISRKRYDRKYKSYIIKQTVTVYAFFQNFLHLLYF